MVTNRWDTKIGKIGFLIDLAQNRLTSRDTIFRTEPYFRKRLPGETADVFIPGGFDFGDEEFKRDRTGLYGALQWATRCDVNFTDYLLPLQYTTMKTQT